MLETLCPSMRRSAAGSCVVRAASMGLCVCALQAGKAVHRHMQFAHAVTHLPCIDMMSDTLPHPCLNGVTAPAKSTRLRVRATLVAIHTTLPTCIVLQGRCELMRYKQWCQHEQDHVIAKRSNRKDRVDWPCAIKLCARTRKARCARTHASAPCGGLTTDASSEVDRHHGPVRHEPSADEGFLVVKLRNCESRVGKYGRMKIATSVHVLPRYHGREATDLFWCECRAA
jgi:hypothetical protein